MFEKSVYSAVKKTLWMGMNSIHSNIQRKGMKNMKKWLTVMTLAIMVGAVGQLRAAVSDGLTITIQPNAGYAVDIDTTGVTLTFSGQALNMPAYVVLPATVTIESTLATTDLQLDASLSGGWSLTNSTGIADGLQAWVVFTSTTVSSCPAKSGQNFDDTDDRLQTSRDVGDAGNYYEDGSFEADSQAKNQESHMWIRFHTPPSTSDNTDKVLSLTLTAELPN